MKKVIIIVLIVAVIIGIIVVMQSNVDIQKVLSKYDSYENDGYEEDGGYIVSKKTEEGYRYGYINHKGKLVLNVEYNMIYRISGIEEKNKVYLVASRNGRYGVTLNGKILINYEYQLIEFNANNEIFVLNKNDKYGTATINGEIIIPVEKSYIESKGMYIYVNDNDNTYVCDSTGKQIDVDFNATINETENEQYYIKTMYKDEDYKYQICDKYGNSILENEYNYLEYAFGEYFIAGNENGKQGLIDTQGNIKIEFNYTLLQNIQNANAIRTLDITTNETEIYSSKFEKVCSLKNAIIETTENEIKVHNENTQLVLDMNGNIKNN